MADHFTLGETLKGDKIFLEAGFIPTPREIKIGKHHSYRTYGETNATAYISKPFQWTNKTPIK
ncbi:MAG: hypothetical protein HYT70_02350 [Candidatus Aenigmarchaeota archaeon]|nr:hypothetical protein [Candidatus Aenigmarchaeota archaeon]